jgi:glycosyltransferase involved in cell wall biosynthesis
MLSRRLVMLVSNACAPDRRVLREAEAIAQRGHQVKVIAWDREGGHAAKEKMGLVEIERVAVPSTYGSGMRRLGQWPAYARQVLAGLGQKEWHAVHCHDLDTLPIGYAYARRRDTPLVFDAHESYPDLIAPQVPGWFVNVARWLERFLVRRVDALITVGELLAEHYRPWAKRVAVVRNCHRAGPASSNLAALRSGWKLEDQKLVICYIGGLEDQELVICYIGGFTRGRVILPLIEAVKADPTLGLVLVGDGPQAPAIFDAMGGNGRIVYLGPRVPPDRVVEIMRATDVVYYGLRSDFPNNRFSSPNALYAALAAGRPLLTTGIGEISQVVREEGCGLILPESATGSPTVDAMSQALTELRVPEIRAEMAQEALRAGEEKYNWSAAEATLLDLYRQLWGCV